MAAIGARRPAGPVVAASGHAAGTAAPALPRPQPPARPEAAGGDARAHAAMAAYPAIRRGRPDHRRPGPAARQSEGQPGRHRSAPARGRRRLGVGAQLGRPPDGDRGPAAPRRPGEPPCRLHHHGAGWPGATAELRGPDDAGRGARPAGRSEAEALAGEPGRGARGTGGCIHRGQRPCGLAVEWPRRARRLRPRALAPATGPARRAHRPAGCDRPRNRLAGQHAEGAGASDHSRRGRRRRLRDGDREGRRRAPSRPGASRVRRGRGQGRGPPRVAERDRQPHRPPGNRGRDNGRRDAADR